MKTLYTKVLSFLLHKDNLFRIVALSPLVVIVFFVTWFLVSLPSALLTLGYAICGVILVDYLIMWVDNAYEVAKNFKEKFSKNLETVQSQSVKTSDTKVEKTQNVTETIKPVNIKESRKSTAPSAPTVVEDIKQPVKVKNKSTGRGRPKSTPKEN